MNKLIQDLDALYYAKNSGFQESKAHRLIDLYFNPIANSNILDIGCGDGKITSHIANLAPQSTVLGIDASLSMISHAQEYYANPPKVDFLHCCAGEFTTQKRFDFVFSFNCFHWIEEGKKALQLAYNHLKPGGKLLILSCPRDSPYYYMMDTAIQRMPFLSQSSARTTMLRTEEYRKILAEVGADFEVFGLKEMTAEYLTLEDIQKFVSGWLHCYIKLPATRKEEFFSVLGEVAMDYRMPGSGDKYIIPYKELTILVKKPRVESSQ